MACPETDTLRLHDPIDHRPASLTGAFAAPDVLSWIDARARFMIVVERAQTHQLIAEPFELDSARLGQPLHRDLLFEPVNYFIGDARHLARPPFRVFPKKPVKSFLEHSKLLQK
jgi:hypothetical protein